MKTEGKFIKMELKYKRGNVMLMAKSLRQVSNSRGKEQNEIIGSVTQMQTNYQPQDHNSHV